MRQLLRADIAVKDSEKKFTGALSWFKLIDGFKIEIAGFAETIKIDK